MTTRVLHGAIRRSLLLIPFMLVCLPAPAQVEVSGARLDVQESMFFVDAMSFASQTGTDSRLDVFTQIGYDALSFVKQNEAYNAAYEMTISIFDSTSTLVSEKLWTEEVKGVPFERSVSPALSSITQRVFEIKPGSYMLRVVMRDKESGVSRQATRKILVPNFSQPDFSLSDIMLLSRVSTQAGKRSITPYISANVGAIPEAFFAYIEVYNARKLDTIHLLTDVVNEKSERILRVDTLVALNPGRNERILRIPHTTLPLGDFRLLVRARSAHDSLDENTASLAATNRQIYVRWSGMPRSVKDLDVAIEQVRYIAKDDELSMLKDAETQEEKQTRFMEFWKKRDPNPNTPRNERMEEYYARVEYANKHFTHYIEGWRSDMGMVYIIFGAPSNVDRHPFEVDSKPYEVWAYYELNYSFVFIDQTGFGDYRLETPLWEVWQRPRN
jgi:GWxTD domain-containing protein